MYLILTDALEFIQTTWNIFWGGAVFQLFFLSSLLVIYVKENVSWKRQLMLWYPIIIFVILLNPIAVYIGDSPYTWYGDPAYFCRQFSLASVFTVMAYAFVLILRDVSGIKRLVCFAIICLMVVLYGTNIYTKGFEFQRSGNLSKIPNDVIRICDRLDEEGKDITIAAPSSLTHYFRQYDPSLHLITAVRDDGELAKNLDSQEPDVNLIMETSCSIGGDYVVAVNGENVRRLYAEAGHEPFFETASCLVYECKGFPGYWKKYNDKDQIIGLRYYDVEKKPVMLDGGYAGINYKYNSKGYQSKITYLDLRSKPVLTVSGYAIVSYVYDKEGHIREAYYFDEHKRPIALSAGNEGYRYSYDGEGRQDSVTYIDRHGKVIKNTVGYSKEVYHYNDLNQVYECLLYDKKDHPVMCAYQYAGYQDEFDEQSRLVRRVYIDKDLKECMTVWGYSSFTRSYDEAGNPQDVYYDLDGKPIA